MNICRPGCRNRAGIFAGRTGRWTLMLIGLLLCQWPAIAQDVFDHFSTGFPLDGAHVNVTCEACHVSATFGTTESSCTSCHSQGGLVRSSSKPANHIPTTGECTDCHVTASWSAVTFVDHASLVGGCVTCHDGIQAPGKTPSHISSGDQCDDCHNTNACSKLTLRARKGQDQCLKLRRRYQRGAINLKTSNIKALGLLGRYRGRQHQNRAEHVAQKHEFTPLMF